MNNLLLVIVGSQLLFTTSDLLARHNMSTYGFKISTFLSVWFVFYMTLRIIATFGQLYIFTQLEVGRTMALFGASSLVLVNVLGLLILKEQMSITVYFGIMLAILAILLVGFSK